MPGKIVFNLLASESRGGMEKVFLDYAEIMKQDGYKVVAVVPKKFRYFPQLEKLNISCEILNVSGHYDHIAAIKFLFLCRKYKPSLIIAHNGRAFALVNFVRGFLKGIKDIAVCHGGGFKRMMNFSYAITISKFLSDKLTNEGYNGEVFYVPNFLKFDLALPKMREKKRGFSFGAISRLDKNKNFAFLIKAFAQIQEENIELVIAGDGEEKENLEKLVKDLGIGEKVRFLGWFEDSKEFFEGIDCLVHPALIEAFGLVVIEGMSHRLPVIAADSLGPKEIITDYHNGLLFQPNDITDLKQKMLLVLKNNELRGSLARHGYELAHTEYSFSRGKKNLLQVIDKINAE